MTIPRKTLILGSLILALALLVPLTAQATAYTWTGTTSNAWALSTNWTGGTFPGNGTSYTDQASILGTSGSNKPAILGSASTILLGGAATALTTSGTSALSPLDIQGTLGMQGNIVNSRSSGTGTERITIEGTLRNDGSSGTIYTISGTNGSIALLGGTISSQNGGIWAFQQPVSGYGTISSPFTNTSTISANTSGQTLHITGSSTAGGTLASSVAGAILSLESAITGATLSHTGEIDLNGATLTNTTLANVGTGAINLTGNSTLAGTYTRNSNTPITFNGHTLTMNGVTVSNVSGGTASFAIGTGTMKVANSVTSISNGDPITLAGGSITATGGGSLTNAAQIIGRGTISAPVTLSGSGIVRASGGMLSVTGPLTTSGTTILTNGVAGDVLDLQGTVTATTNSWIYPNPSGNTGPGVVQFNGATINAPTAAGQVLTLGQGAVNVTNNSTVTGNITSNATLGISGKQLNASGATFTNTNLGTVHVTNGTALWGNFTNNGAYISDPSTSTFNTLTVGSTGYLTGATGDVFQIKGNFINNSTQNASWNTTAATLAFLTGTSSAHNVALAGADLGQNLTGYATNFAWGTLNLTGQSLTLSDGNGTPGGALYVGLIQGLTFGGLNNLTITDISSLNGLNIYYDPGLNLGLHGKTYNLTGGGFLEPVPASAVPIPPSVLLLGSGLLGIALMSWRRKTSLAA